jgi:DNA-binding IclR family transcriptional regulator
MDSTTAAPTAKMKYHPPAVQRALQLLILVAEAPVGLGITELANTLGLSKSTVHGLANALLQAGALYQSPKGKKYFLGTAILDMAFRNWNYIQVSEQVQQFLDELRDRIGETVFLGVLSQTAAIIMTKAESHNPLKISSPAGTSIPLLAGAVGKVFLAQRKDEDALRIIREHGLPRFTPKSIVDEDCYLQELALVRQQRYALDNEEYLPGIKAIATALGNRHGLPLAIWVVGFAGSMEDTKMPDVLKKTLATAEVLRSLLDSGL